MTEQTAEYPYHYFVSYSWTWGKGSGDISLAEPVRGWSDIALLGKLATQSVRREHPNVEVGEVVILNYQLMSGPEHGKAEQALRDLLDMVGQFDAPHDPGRVREFLSDARRLALRGLGEPQ